MQTSIPPGSKGRLTGKEFPFEREGRPIRPWEIPWGRRSMGRGSRRSVASRNRHVPRRKKPKERGGEDEKHPKKSKKEERKGWKLAAVAGGLLTGLLGAVLHTVVARKKLVTRSRNIGDRLLGKPIVETEHATCRMGCRFINKQDVRKALEKGTINDKKSDLKAAPYPKIAFDDGRVRAVFSEYPKETRVVTVIDTETEHICPPC